MLADAMAVNRALDELAKRLRRKLPRGDGAARCLAARVDEHQEVRAVMFRAARALAAER